MNYENEGAVLPTDAVIDGEPIEEREASADSPTDSAEISSAVTGTESYGQEDALALGDDATGQAPGEPQRETGNEYTLEGDISALLNEIPSLRETLGGGINAARYSELRRMGLSAKEAYLAASSRTRQDNRSHMVTGVPHGASSPTGGMSSSEMELARGLFSGIPESEIKRLYAKVTK